MWMRALILSAGAVIVRTAHRQGRLRYPALMPSSPRHPLTVLSLAAALLGGWLAWPAAAAGRPGITDGAQRILWLEGEPFTVELATTAASRSRGLMFREPLAAGQGMLFVFSDEAPRSFWMKNVRFAIDIVYLDADWHIVRVVAQAPSCLHTPCPGYPSRRPARYALELPAGTADRLGLEMGERLPPPSWLP